MKRIFDIIFSSIVIILFLPLGLIIVSILKLTGEGEMIYKQSRIGQYSEPFGLFKFVTMVKDSPNLGAGDITIENDPRVLPFGKFLRKTKLNEFPQFINVLIGDMSLVGPRPNVKRDVDLYSDVEMKLLTVRPGITDFSSIVFSDEGDILEGVDDPDLSYNQLIRPWKSRLGILYIENQGLLLDIKLILLTLIAIFNKPAVLNIIVNELKKLTTDPELIQICKRETDLKPAKPPGLHEVVKSRDL